MDTRREPRFAAELPAVVVMQSRAASRRHATVRNFSRSGMLLELAFPAEPGERLTVQWDGGQAWATVAHCRPAADCWLAGVELDQPVEAGVPPMHRIAQAASVPIP